MAVIRDVMPAFELFQPATVDDALRLLDQYGEDALGAGRRPGQLRLAEGSDQAPESRGRSEPDQGADGRSHHERRPRDRRDDHADRSGAPSGDTRSIRLLSQAAELVASPQIRNQGTIGGNVSQDARCWYYRGGWKCYRAGGNICFADTPTAINREHAILGADRCVAVNPSDTAPALIALDAQMVSQREEASAW